MARQFRILYGLGLLTASLSVFAYLLVALRHVREQLVDVLPKLVGDERIVTRVGEQWSARKVLRRALWHERAHTQQIATLIREQVP